MVKFDSIALRNKNQIKPDAALTVINDVMMITMMALSILKSLFDV
jgi:hypothetical protein